MTRDFSITVQTYVPSPAGTLAIGVPAIYEEVNGVGRVVVEREQLQALLIQKCVALKYVRAIVAEIKRMEFRYSPILGVKRVKRGPVAA